MLRQSMNCCKHFKANKQDLPTQSQCISNVTVNSAHFVTNPDTNLDHISLRVLFHVLYSGSLFISYLAIKMRLEPLPTSVIIPVYMRRAQSSSCDPRHVVGLKHESQSVGLQLFGLFIGLLNGLLISAGVRAMWCHAQMQASTCTEQHFSS